MATKGKINVDFAMRYVGALHSNRYIANPDRYSTIAYKDIVEYAAKAAHVPASSVEVAMDALYDALSYFVLNGHGVKIDGLGTFNFGVNAYAMEDSEDAGADAVHRMKIHYLPEMSLRNALNNVAISTSYSNPNNLSEDTSAPAVVVGSVAGYTTSNWNKVGGTGTIIPLVDNSVYLRFTGYRLDRELTFTCQGKGYDGSTFEDVTLNATVVKQSATQYIVRLQYSGSGSYSAIYLYRETLIDTALGSTVFDHYHTISGYSEATIVGIYVNGSEVTSKSSPVSVAESDSYVIRLFGANMQGSDLAVTFTNCTATLKSSAGNLRDYVLTDIEGTVVMTCTDTNETTKSFVFASAGGSSSGTPSVSALTANNVSIANGGSSTIVAGNSYAFTMSGSNLGSVVQSDLVIPSGSSISNFSATASMVQFTLVNAQAGTIGLNYNGSSIFSVTVTEEETSEDSAEITTIGGVADGGSYDISSANAASNLVLAIVGSNLSELTASMFTIDGSGAASFELNEGSDSARSLTLASGWTLSSGDKILVQRSGTTIFTLNITGTATVSF